MKYKVYFKGTECRIPGCITEDSKTRRFHPPYSFEMDVSITLRDGGYVDCEVYALNDYSRNALASATPYISRYGGRFAPYSTIDLPERSSKSRHKMWANKDNTVGEFDEGRYPDSARFGISLYALDDRLSDPTYGVYQEYPPPGGQSREQVQTVTLVVAFRVALVSPSKRTIAISEPYFIRFEQVGGGEYQNAVITTFEEFCNSHKKFRDE